MANAEQLKILKSGVEGWNMWRKKNSSIQVDLTGAYLSGADLTGAYLHRADLSGADLSGADLSGAYLSGADLTGTKLFGADLSGAYLVEAALSGADLSGADLSVVHLYRANLSGAHLYGANLFRADLTGASLFSTTLKNTDFNKAVIGYTIFGLTNLRTVKNLETVRVAGECTIDFQTLRDSKNIPKEFLFKIGLPENFIDYLPDFYEEKTLRLHPAFLSHSSSDKEFATKLYEELTRRRVRVWYDEKQLLPGDDIRGSIHKGISLYDKFIIVCSKDSLKSWWVDEEIGRALKKNEEWFKEKKQRIQNIIPITLDDFVFKGWDSKYRDNILDLKVGDFTKYQDEAVFNIKVDELIKVLNADRGEGAPGSLF